LGEDSRIVCKCFELEGVEPLIEGERLTEEALGANALQEAAKLAAESAGVFSAPEGGSPHAKLQKRCDG